MGIQKNIPNIKPGDWTSVRQVTSRLALRIGPESIPTFGGLILSNPLEVPYGGTGAATLTDHGILLGSGTGVITPLAAATNGQLPIGSTGADPVLATLTGTANQVTVTNGAGSITLSVPQNIHTGATPTFAGLQTDLWKSNDGNDELIRWTGGAINFQQSMVGNNNDLLGIGVFTAESISDGFGTLYAGDLTGLYSLEVGNITISGAVITSDTGAISFINENLSTTGIITGNSLITAANIGIAADTDLLSLAANALTINGKISISSSQDGNALGLVLVLTNTFDGAAPIFTFSRGLDFMSKWLPDDGATGNKTCSNLDGCYGQALLDTINVTNAHNYTVTIASGIRAFVAATKGGSHTGDATITTGAALYVDNGSVTGGATITTQYGLYIESLTVGTTNYAIYTNSGPCRFGDKVMFTQTDGNEYIDSLTDGYMDYGATTGHRFNANIEIADAKNIILDTTTGTKIGTATNQKLGFFNATPVVQQSYTAISDPPTQAEVTAIRDTLINLGLMAAA